MGIRTKLLLVITFLGFAPMLVFGAWLYKESVGAVEAELRAGNERDASAIAQEVEIALLESEALLSELARSSALRVFIVESDQGLISPTGPRSRGAEEKSGQYATQRSIPEGVKESVRAIVRTGPKLYTSITCLSSSGKTLFRAEPIFVERAAGTERAGTDVNFKNGDSLSGKNIDARVWTSADQKPLRAPLVVEPGGATVRYSVPVFAINEGPGTPRGALIVELNGNAIFDDATSMGVYQGLDSPTPAASATITQFIVVLAQDGDILFHTNEVLRHQRVDSVMPTFREISTRMIAGQSGTKFYDTVGSTWLVAYRPVASLGASVGVAGDYTIAAGSVKRTARITFVLFALFGLATGIVIAIILRNTTRSIERVTKGAVAIAGGRLEHRIEVRTNDETRVLADSFNIMTDRLREQIAREAESRQFESFMRLSAMLTHDLKNAIAGLSLLVGNMGRKFHREEFRADAMNSLTEATNKLRNLVSKLSEPVQTLSSEHKMARPADLVPIIRKALETTVEAAGDLHSISVKLPKALIATVEADRIEKVVENLVINALEAMGGKSGKLSVEAGAISDSEVFFSVSDTGTGISAEFQHLKLFRPFATTKKTGIGLGLYACREIIEAHGGRIDVTSSRGSGATFRVVLPFAPKLRID